MKRSYGLLAGLVVSGLTCIQMAGAATNYVDRYGTNPVSKYTNWATAAVSIQDAVDVADAGNTVLVSNGVYDTGSKITPSYELTNRVCATTAIILRSVNGPNYTSIKGAPAPNGLVGQGGLGTGAVRCVYLSGGASLIGFTLTNGYATTNGTAFVPNDRGGAGVLVISSGSVSNCVIVGNNGCYRGGGVCLSSGGTLDNCIISNNFCTSYGGGVYLSTGAKINNCIVVGNLATNFGGGVQMNGGTEANNCLITGNTNINQGGGVFAWGSSMKLNSCTIVGNNSGPSHGGGLEFYAGTNITLTNCIVWGNTTTLTTSNYYESTSTAIFSYVCSGPIKAGTGNTGSDPQFVGQATGNYRLAANSPCVNAGIYQSWMTSAADLDGHRRLDKFSGIVDMGCYEYVPKGTLITVP
ncbi:MAG: right-handed parallel beta-helix repeat-containing protein [Verrucomicrobia bacterium]|nr:right-handed parallel beta-helix repeat-containing protein [Verrucomicrobiota bacterium]MBU1857565.1 right-handed parallel beta-helix repeat-containing protein [Verrucomicrobiota bacterium]